MTEEALYSAPVKRAIYHYKERLPADFPLVTRVEEGRAIVIVVEMRHFAWRTVEDRLSIALTLTELRESIERCGVWCLIEKE